MDDARGADKAEATLADRDAAIADLRKQMAAVTGDAGTLKRDLDERAKAAFAGADGVASGRARHGTAHQQHSARRDCALNTQLAAANKSAAELEAKLQQERAERTRIEEASRKAEQEARSVQQRLQSELDAARAAGAAQLESTQATLQQQLADERQARASEAAAAQTRADELTAELGRMRDVAAALEKDLAASRTQATELQRSLDATRASLKECESKLAAASTQAQSLQLQLSAAHGEAGSASETIGRLQRELAEAKAAHQRQLDELNRDVKSGAETSARRHAKGLEDLAKRLEADFNERAAKVSTLSMFVYDYSFHFDYIAGV